MNEAPAFSKDINGCWRVVTHAIIKLSMQLTCFESRKLRCVRSILLSTIKSTVIQDESIAYVLNHSLDSLHSLSSYMAHAHSLVGVVE